MGKYLHNVPAQTRVLAIVFLVLFSLPASTRAQEGYSALLVWGGGKEQNKKKRKVEKWNLRAVPGKVRLETLDKKMAFIYIEGQGTTHLNLKEKLAYSGHPPNALIALTNINSDIAESGNACLQNEGECKKVGQQKKFGRLCEKWTQVETNFFGKPKGKMIVFIEKELRVIVARRLADGHRLELQRFKPGPQPPEAFTIPEDFKR